MIQSINQQLRPNGTQGQMPNFLIIGAAKSGTTTLYNYLDQHPDIFLSENKEPNYFALNGQTAAWTGPRDHRIINCTSISRLERYQQLFAHTNAIARGEASVLYLYRAEAAVAIQQQLPGIKLIVILRDPVERAYSNYKYMVSKGAETKTFEEALQAEPTRIANGWSHIWHYQALGFYHAQLVPYFARFAQDQIKIIFYEELRTQPILMLRSLTEFLNVNPDFSFDISTHYNRSGRARWQPLQTWLTEPSAYKNLVKPIVPRHLRARMVNQLLGYNCQGKFAEMMPSTRDSLRALYRRDIESLQTLIHCDLSAWLPK